MGWKRSHVPPPSVHDEATLTKEELERIKLALEIAELRRPWWQKSAYPINALIGLCSISIMFITGSFQANSLRLENEKFLLEQKMKDFEASSRSKNNNTITMKFPSGDLIKPLPSTTLKISGSSHLKLEGLKLLNKKQAASKAKSVGQPQLLFPNAKLSPILVRDQDRELPTRLALPPALQARILEESAGLSANK